MFPTEAALKAYLAKHPNADPKKHSVKQSEQPAQESDAEAREPKPKEDTSSSEAKPKTKSNPAPPAVKKLFGEHFTQDDFVELYGGNSLPDGSARISW